MKIPSTPEASAHLLEAVKTLKNDHARASAMIFEWQAATTAPWLAVSSRQKIIIQLLSELLAEEGDEALLLFMPCGSIILLAGHLRNAAHVAVTAWFHKFLAEFHDETFQGDFKPYDLSVAWEEFLTVSARIHKASQGKRHDPGELLARLEAMLAECGPQLAKRLPENELQLLFVEDERSTQILLRQLLGAEKAQIRFATNAEEAVKAYCARPPHIVFLDINLPDITGLELLEMISRHDPNVYAVMLTAQSRESQVHFAINHRARGYIVKPFSMNKLQSAFRQYRNRSIGG